MLHQCRPSTSQHLGQLGKASLKTTVTAPWETAMWSMTVQWWVMAHTLKSYFSVSGLIEIVGQPGFFFHFSDPIEKKIIHTSASAAVTHSGGKWDAVICIIRNNVNVPTLPNCCDRKCLKIILLHKDLFHEHMQSEFSPTRSPTIVASSDYNLRAEARLSWCLFPLPLTSFIGSEEKNG